VTLATYLVSHWYLCVEDNALRAAKFMRLVAVRQWALLLLMQNDVNTITIESLAALNKGSGCSTDYHRLAS
jgi:hypothetical protein